MKASSISRNTLWILTFIFLINEHASIFFIFKNEICHSFSVYYTFPKAKCKKEKSIITLWRLQWDHVEKSCKKEKKRKKLSGEISE